MKIQHITCLATDLDAMRSFYAGTLQMPVVTEEADRFTVQIGASLLTYRRSESPAFYHLAFLLAPEACEAIRARLTQAIGLLADRDGNSVLFESERWQAKQFYFEDPDRNILEILGTTAGESVTASAGQAGEPVALPWVRIGEVGLPVPNLAEFISQIRHIVPTELPGDSETFQFYGDDQGVLVLVRQGRPWFPTDRGATAHEIEVVLEGPQEGVVQIGPITLKSIANT